MKNARCTRSHAWRERVVCAAQVSFSLILLSFYFSFILIFVSSIFSSSLLEDKQTFKFGVDASLKGFLFIPMAPKGRRIIFTKEHNLKNKVTARIIKVVEFLSFFIPPLFFYVMFRFPVILLCLLHDPLLVRILGLV